MSLIMSPRHSKADLECWKEMERADKSHANSAMLRRNWDRCVESVVEFRRYGQCHCSVSWGKDSILAAYASIMADRTIPLCWIRVEPFRSPECVAVRDAFLKMFPFASYDEVVIECPKDEFGYHAKGSLERGIELMDKKHGPRTILGIRASESSRRFLSVFHDGIITKNRCRPCALLSTKDVFGLLYKFNLPVHPAYAMTGNGRWPREHLRVSSLCGKRGQEFGRWEWEREFYGDELRRLGE